MMALHDPSQGQADPEMHAIRSRLELGATLIALGADAKALPEIRAAIAQLETLVRAGRSDLLGELAQARTQLGTALSATGKQEEGIAELRQAIALHETLVSQG